MESCDSRIGLSSAHYSLTLDGGFLDNTWSDCLARMNVQKIRSHTFQPTTLGPFYFSADEDSTTITFSPSETSLRFHAKGASTRNVRRPRGR
jgi:hypothetical protein